MKTFLRILMSLAMPLIAFIEMGNDIPEKKKSYWHYLKEGLKQVWGE